MTKTATDILHLDPTNDFFSHFFSHNPWPMWVYDTETLAFLEVNASAIEMYGYSKEEFLGMTIKDIRPNEDFEALEKYVTNAGPQSKGDKRWRHTKKNGAYMWVTISSFEVIFNERVVRLVTVNDVTKSHSQERALYQANRELEDYKNAITTSSIVSITNRQGVIEYANDNFIKLTGYSSWELVGSSHHLINSGYHSRSFWQEMWNTVMQGHTWRGEVCNRKKNGELYWVDSFVIPVANDDGFVERLFSMGIDITERKNKESEVITLNRQLVAINLELTESKKELEKLSLVARLTASQVFMLNNKREITWVNDAFIRQTGYTLAEAYGKLPEKLLHGPNSYRHATNLIKEAFSNRQPFNTEVLHYSKTGDEIILLADGQPVLDADGNLLQYVIVETDITELKAKQRAIASSEIKLNAFFSNTTSLHLLLDKNLHILAFNKVAKQAAESIMGTAIAEGDYLPGKLIGTLKEDVSRYAVEALSGHAVAAKQSEIRLTDGSVRAWQAHYLPAYDRVGNIIGCAFTAVDITDRKKAEDKINRQNAMLKEVAWKQSHVVRAPLANILSLTNLLENNCDDKVLLLALKHETEKLDGIIKDMVSKTIQIKNEAS